LRKSFLVEGQKYRLKSADGPELWEGDEERRSLVGQVLAFVKEYEPCRDEYYFFWFTTEAGKQVHFLVLDRQVESVDWSIYLEPLSPVL
jgi:hypothetical protein